MFRYGFLVWLLAGWAAAQSDDMVTDHNTYPPECRKLVSKFKYCGEKKNWTNSLQEFFSKKIGTPEFVNRTKQCLATALPEGQGERGCEDPDELEILLHCSKMALFKMIPIEKKYASVRFYTGFQHCVRTEMGFINDFKRGTTGDMTDEEGGKTSMSPEMVYDTERKDERFDEGSLDTIRDDPPMGDADQRQGSLVRSPDTDRIRDDPPMGDADQRQVSLVRSPDTDRIRDDLPMGDADQRQGSLVRSPDTDRIRDDLPMEDADQRQGSLVRSPDTDRIRDDYPMEDAYQRQGSLVRSPDADRIRDDLPMEDADQRQGSLVRSPDTDRISDDLPMEDADQPQGSLARSPDTDRISDDLPMEHADQPQESLVRSPDTDRIRDDLPIEDADQPQESLVRSPSIGDDGSQGPSDE